MAEDYIEVDYKTITNTEKRRLLRMMNSPIINGFTTEDYVDILSVIGRVVKRIRDCGAKTDKEMLESEVSE